MAATAEPRRPVRSAAAGAASGAIPAAFTGLRRPAYVICRDILTVICRGLTDRRPPA